MALTAEKLVIQGDQETSEGSAGVAVHYTVPPGKITKVHIQRYEYGTGDMEAYKAYLSLGGMKLNTRDRVIGGLHYHLVGSTLGGEATSFLPQGQLKCILVPGDTIATVVFHGGGSVDAASRPQVTMVLLEEDL